MNINKFGNAITSAIKALPLSILLITNGVSAETCNIISNEKGINRERCGDFDYYVYNNLIQGKIGVVEVSRALTFVFESNYNEKKIDKYGGTLNINANIGGCNATRGNYGGEDVVVTAKHCFVDNEGDVWEKLSNKLKITKKDDLIVGKRKFEKNTLLSIEKFPQSEIRPLLNLENYLGKEFFILGQKNGHSYVINGILVELRINKKIGVYQGTIFIPGSHLDQKIRQKHNGLNGFSGAPVFLLGDSSYSIVGVLSGEYFNNIPDALSIAFFSLDSEVK